MVTAQRREENLQDVPIAATAFEGDQLEAKAVDAVADLQFAAPSLSVTEAGETQSVNIRGIGIASNSPNVSNGVATYIGGATFLGVYFALNSGTVESMVYDTVLEETGRNELFERWLGRVRAAESVALLISALGGGLLAAHTSTRFTYFATLPQTAIACLDPNDPTKTITCPQHDPAVQFKRYDADGDGKLSRPRSAPVPPDRSRRPRRSRAPRRRSPAHWPPVARTTSPASTPTMTAR